MEYSIKENFRFAFNDKDFSDRVLHIQIIPDEVSLSSSKIEKSLSLDSSAQTHNNDDSDCSSVGVKVITLYISSPILAAKSSFFYKIVLSTLFKSEMKESQQKDVTLKINSSEEEALMDLIKFIYMDTLSASEFSELVDVLMAADKFGVKSCIKECIHLLLMIPMSLDSALLYLDLPLIGAVIKPLLDRSKWFLAEYFRDFHKSKEEAMKLPLIALETVLDSKFLQVNTEDDIYNFILDWGREHYPELKERREVLTNRLARLIHFPYMTPQKLRQVLSRTDFHHETASKLVMEALFIKAQVPYGQHIHATRRHYNHRLVSVVHIKSRSPRVAVYFDLKRGDYMDLLPSDVIFTEPFSVGRERFYLVAQKGYTSRQFGLFLYMMPGESETCTVDCDFAVMKKPENRFEIERREFWVLTAGERKGWTDFFEVSLADLISYDFKCFVDGIMHLKVDITLQSQPFNLVGDQWFSLVAYCSKESSPHFGLLLYATIGAKTCTFDLDIAVMRSRQTGLQARVARALL
ncbi:hypothetical protein V2J09_017260 [Rumex salicifolius]